MNHYKLVVLTLVVVIAVGLCSKLAWDDYQFKRASEQLPSVIDLSEQFRPPHGSKLVGTNEISVNEYSTSVWRKYETATAYANIRQHFNALGQQTDFELRGENEVYNGKQLLYRNGEYEVRVIHHQTEEADTDLSINVNWYGLER